MEGMAAHGIGKNRQEREERVKDILTQVGLDPAMIHRYPHEFSGGQRQRIGIARCLAVEPDFIVCDEATSALDVSVQAQILNLLKALQVKLGLTYLFITHNLGLVEYLADEVAVMYLGRIVEQGKTEQVFQNPRHPYTQVLLAAVPKLDPDTGVAKIRLSGDVPSPIDPPVGVIFIPAVRPPCPTAKRCSRPASSSARKRAHRPCGVIYTQKKLGNERPPSRGPVREPLPLLSRDDTLRRHGSRRHAASQSCRVCVPARSKSCTEAECVRFPI